MKEFEKVPENKWQFPPKNLIEAWYNRQFLVQVVKDNGYIRLTINRCAHRIIKGQPVWCDGITWDQIQEIKSHLGYGDKWAVECYPPDDYIVNVANMRHIWLLEEEPKYGWKPKDAE